MDNFNTPVFERKKDESYSTKAIHVGSNPDQWSSKSVVPPITMSVTFKQDEPGEFEFDYGRAGNPSRQLLEECLAALEGAKHGLCFSSGLAAVSTVATLLCAGDHVLCDENVYGGSLVIFKDIFSKLGVETTFIDGTDVEEIRARLKSNTKMVFLESETNPMLTLPDIQEIASIVHFLNKDILIVVDNTLLTSYLQKPLELGADIVTYSLTKYMNGHSDVNMGAVIVDDDGLCERLRFLQEFAGSVPSPFDCSLVTRGLKTLQLRMDQHMKNGLAVATFLESHPLVEKVFYPGLPSHPQHELVKRVCSGCSGMCSFYIKGGGLKESKIFLKSLKVFTLAASLGGFESLVGLPLLTMPSVSFSESEKNKRSGITDNFIRLSIGLESARDLIEDLDQALKSITKTKLDNNHC